jgi:hypothetical protein
MKGSAWLVVGGVVCGLFVACGGADQTSLLGDDGGGSGKDGSVSEGGPGPDGAANDAPVVKDVVTVDVPVGPGDSHIQCGPSLTCSAQNEVCCHHTFGTTTQQWECVQDASSCNNYGDVPIECSSHENCVSQGLASYVCCADTTYNGGQCNVATDVSCQSACDPNSGQFQVGCGTNDPCPVNQSCIQSSCSLIGYDICI